MPGSAIGKKLNLGYVGKISRTAGDEVVTRIVSDASGATAIPFGAPVFLNDDNTVRNVASADTLAKFVGFAAASVKQATDYTNTQVVYGLNEPCDILTRGSIVVKVDDGTPVAGGKVYLVTTADTGIAVGDIVCAAVTNKTIELPATFTTGYKDTNGLAEITLLTKNVL